MATTRNPPWSRDEHIVALDFYLRHAPNIPGKDSAEVSQLSELLNEMQRRIEGSVPEKFRNPSGVYMKLMNFRRFDPAYSGVGLAHGNKDEEVVWNLYAQRPTELRKTAEHIKSFAHIDEKEVSPAVRPEEADEEEDALEGTILTRVHRYRERDREIIKKKRVKFASDNGRLFCQACGFDFQRFYGERGEDFIECHHTRPVSELEPGEKTKLSDLALLCSNCHRMIHRKRPWLTLDELKQLIKAS